MDKPSNVSRLRSIGARIGRLARDQASLSPAERLRATHQVRKAPPAGPAGGATEPWVGVAAEPPCGLGHHPTRAGSPARPPPPAGSTTWRSRSPTSS